MQAIHDQFKELVVSYRPQIDIESVASGEYWTAKNALALGLIDDVTTSDTYLSELMATAEVWAIKTPKKRNIKELIVSSARAVTRVVIEQLSTDQTMTS